MEKHVDGSFVEFQLTYALCICSMQDEFLSEDFEEIFKEKLELSWRNLIGRIVSLFDCPLFAAADIIH